MKVLRLIKISIVVFAVLVGANIFFTLRAEQANSERLRAYAMRKTFIMAGHELRMTSMDLTRLARSYIVMGMEPQLERYWEELLVVDRMSAVRQTFVDNDASPSEMRLLDQALGYQARLRAIDAQAIEARAAGEYELALDITYGLVYAAYGAAFVSLVTELGDSAFARTQEIVKRAEKNVSIFEALALSAIVLLGIVIVFGMIAILREVKATMQREREAAEKERDALELTQAILDSAPIAIGVWDDNYNLTVASQQAAEMLGISDPQEIMGSQFHKFAPEYQPCGMLSVEKALRNIDKAYSKGYGKSKWTHITKTGELLPTEIVMKRFERKDKVMLVSYTIDLREINAAMEKEREAKELNRMYLDACPMFIEIWDDEQRLIECNDKARKFFGLSDKNEFITRYSELSPEHQPCGTQSMQKAAGIVARTLEHGFHRFEWMHKDLGGEPLPVETTFVRLKRNDKDIVVGYSYDLRPIKAAQALTGKMLDSSPLLMEFWDADGNMLDCNRKMLETFQVSKSEFAKRFYDFSAVYQPCGTLAKEKNIEMIKCAIAGEGGLHRAEWMFILPNGEELPTETTWAHIMHQGESVIIVYSQDLRPVKAAIKKEQRAEEESLAKTRFLAHMSHEIRTPMNAILGIAEIQLQNDAHPSETEMAFLRIHNSSKLLINIANDILDLSRVVAGKMEIIPAAYGVASLIIDTVQLNHMHIGNKAIELALNIDWRLPAFLIGDGLRIKQVLNNLLSNAIKYTLEGTVTLSLEMEADRESSSLTLVIVVSDTGQGMSKEQVSTLFREFSRFNTHSNRNIQGSGLGMHITYSLIKLMHGDINVESAPGKGSSFTVRLPQKSYGGDILGKEAVSSLHNMEIYKMTLEKRPKRNIEFMPYGRVLIVDDVDINLHVAEGILGSYKIAVETAASGPEAIAKIKNGAVYDIIFMDHMMPPGMDGVEATKIIQDMGYDQPIVALTANALKGAEKMFIENGFSGFVPKPIDVDILETYLMRFIRDKRQGQGDYVTA